MAVVPDICALSVFILSAAVTWVVASKMEAAHVI